MKEPWASVRGVSKTYGRGPTLVRALIEVDLKVYRGEVTMVQGPSGSGKTTLLQILGLLLRADAGEVWIAGKRMDRLPESRLSRERRRHIGFVFQGFNLLESLTARDNVAVGAWLQASDGKPFDASVAPALRADQCLAQVGLRGRGRHLPHQLSGGEKQRTSIARALACPGRMILADEPTANLDWNNACEVMEHLVKLAHEQDRAVVVVSHDLRLERFADRIIGLADGRIANSRRVNSMTLRSNAPANDGPVDGARHRHRVIPFILIVALGVALMIWVVAQQTTLFTDGAGSPEPRDSSGAGSAGSAPRSAEGGNPAARVHYVAAAPAVVEPVTQLIALGTERAGRIKAILKSAGDRVTAGEPLVLLDDATSAAMVEVRRADLTLAEANLADLEAWYRTEERAQAKARLDRAQALFDRARREFRRVEGLHAVASASATEFNQALEDRRVAEAELEEAGQAYQVAQAGPTPQEVMIAQARVAQAQAALHLAEAQLALLTIRSPIDGHVIYRHREPGEIVDVESERPIISLGQLDQIRLRAEVDESDILRVHLGQSIIATADALGDLRLHGHVIHMEPIMGRKTIRTQRTTERKDTKVREVLIELDPGYPSLPIDLQMTVRFIE